LALDAAAALGEQAGVTSKHEKELWPRWSNWVLLAIGVTSIVTVVAALNDIS
jgi:hypothetical protein